LTGLVGPTVPDLRGLFLRGFGSQSFGQNNGSNIGTTITTHQSGLLGRIQGDAIREIAGGGAVGFDTLAGAEMSGPFYSSPATGRVAGTSGAYLASRQSMAVSRVVPTDNENRPVNTAVRYFIRALK